MRVCAIIVTFNPEIEVLEKTIKDLNFAEIDCCIVDNTNDSYIPPQSPRNYLVRMQDNCGIAKAQNAGIQFSMQNGYEAVIFLDQDSIVNKNSIFELIKTIELGALIAAPVFKDEKSGFFYPIVDISDAGLRQKIDPSTLKGNIKVSTAISSGTIVRTSVFPVVGLMDEDFFIDYVDTEWCLRCARKNISIEIVPAAQMLHSIGDNSLNFRLFRVPVHNPARRYYRIRNSFLLLRKKSIPKLLAIREILFAIIHQALIVTFCPQKIQHSKYMLRALIDAAKRKTGKIA